MKLLISSIVRGSRPDESSGWIHAVETETKTCLRSYPLQESSFLKRNINPRGGLRGARGIAASENRIFITNDTDILIYDPSWTFTNVISHPCCADIHDIYFDDTYLWVTSTANGLIFQFLPDGTLIDTINYRNFTNILQQLNQRVSKKEQMSKEEVHNGFLEFRDPGNYNIDIFDKIHLNSICKLSDGSLLFLAGQCMPWRLAMLWRIKHCLKRLGLYAWIIKINQMLIRGLGLKKQQNSDLAVSLPAGISACIRLINEGNASVSLITPKATVPNHSLNLRHDGTAILADTNTGELIIFDPESSVELQRIHVADGFLRGIEILSPGLAAVGCQNFLYFVDLNRAVVTDKLQIAEDSRVAIYDIKRIPDTFAPFPDSWPYAAQIKTNTNTPA